MEGLLGIGGRERNSMLRGKYVCSLQRIAAHRQSKACTLGLKLVARCFMWVEIETYTGMTQVKEAQRCVKSLQCLNCMKGAHGGGNQCSIAIEWRAGMGGVKGTQRCVDSSVSTRRTLGINRSLGGQQAIATEITPET